MRKKRSDRNFVLYKLTILDEIYIGVTGAIGRAFRKSVKVRLQKHMSRAKCENQDWTLYNFLRATNVVPKYEVIEVVRGRKAAYQRERELIRE